ncbi:MAG TPA: protein kinase [Gemmatimonadales bacterium]|nr:protein kinase [Gemmatimonadales bacterium]
MAERWQRLTQIFDAAVVLAGEERCALVGRLSAGDAELQAEVERLLAAHDRAGSFMASPAISGEALAEIEDAWTGKLIGSYRVVRELGRGGMGAVYLAERADGQYEQRLALKLIKRGMDSEQVLARFRAERQILASLDHPNIARLLDGGTTPDGLPYFVMEHIEGRPIDEYADAHRLSVSARLELILQVCAAVSYAHQHLVVHRDIKPLNILVTGGGVPKLLDFGIAKVLHEGGDELTSTVTGFRLLTPEYASPEQVDGRHATTASDVYSLGVVLYELLTGRSPYRPKGGAIQDIATAVSTTEPDRPSTAVDHAAGASNAPRRRAGVAADRVAATGSGSVEKLRRRLRGDLDTILLTALRKEPQRRYASVEQFAGDIRRHLDGLPVTARPDTFRYRAGKFTRRNRVPLAAGALVALALVAGTVATAWQAREARAAQVRAERRFADVRRLANALLFDYHDAIKDLRGATPVRERLVRDALSYLDGLATEQAGDPALQRELASAYRRVGDVQGGDPKGLGDSEGAVASYTKALGILEALYRADSTDTRNRRELAGLAMALGTVVWERGDLSTGLAHGRRARDMLEPLVAASPGDTDQRLQLHAAYDLLGQLSLEAGQIAEAMEFHRLDLKLLESRPAAERAQPRLRHAISVVYGHLADAQAEADDQPGALESRRRSLELREALAAEFPENAEYERIAQAARYYLASVLGRMKRWDEALDLYRKNLAEDPSAFNEFRTGEALRHLGRPAEAVPHLRRALELHTAAFRADSGNLFDRLAVAGDQAELCSALAALARPDARETCARTVAFIEATAVEPTHAFPRAFFGGVWFALGEAYDTLAARASVRPAERRTHRLAARDMYRRSVEIWTDLTARKLVSPTDTFRLGAAARAAERAEAAL